MPTVTTTVTSAAACGMVTTQTTTEATPEAAAGGGKVVIMDEIFEHWAAGTLKDNVEKYYTPGITVDYGAAFGGRIQGKPALFGKHSGHSGFKAWIDMLSAEWSFTAVANSTTLQASGAAITEFDWTATSNVGNEVSCRDLIKFTIADGKVASIFFYFEDEQKVIDAFVSADAKAALATKGFMLAKPEVTKEDLKGKVALVTGASRGIGKHTAIHLAVNCGMKVALAARSTAKLEETVAEIKAQGGDAIAITLDTSKDEMFGPALDKIEKAFGPVQYCFANAGVANNMSTAPHEFTRADMDYVWDINQKGSLCTFTAVHKHFQKNGGGVFVMNASCGGSMPGECFEQFAGGAIYGASKAALNDLCKGLGANYFKDNIRFYNVCPFGFSTYMLDHIAQDLGGGAISGDDISALNPFFPGKAGPPDAIGPLIEAFFDGDTLYPHGSCVEIDHHVTFNTQLKWDRYGHKLDVEAGQAFFSIAHTPDEIRDVRGRPLSKAELAKLPGVGVSKKFDLGLN